MHARHEVSTKLTLYSHDHSQVLLMYYPEGDVYGLPGGHIDASEQPYDALTRELREELALEIPAMKPAGFFLREGDHGTIILAYIAIAPRDIVITPTNPRKETSIWVDRSALQTMKNISSSYKQFILENWPNEKA